MRALRRWPQVSRPGTSALTSPVGQTKARRDKAAADQADRDQDDDSPGPVCRGAGSPEADSAHEQENHDERDQNAAGDLKGK